jgi:hypothetical protein
LFSDALTGNQWNKDGVPIAGATGVSYTPITGGLSSVTATGALNCSATSDPVSISINAVEEIAGERIMIYPDATGNNFEFYFGAANKKYDLKIFDMHGGMLLDRIISNGELMNAGQLAAGIYLFYFSDRAEAIMRRVVVY